MHSEASLGFMAHATPCFLAHFMNMLKIKKIAKNTLVKFSKNKQYKN